MGSGISLLSSSTLRHQSSSLRPRSFSTSTNYQIFSPSASSKSFPLPQRRLSSRVVSFITGTPKLSNYYIGGVIGKGGFGKIREIKRKKDNQWFALKSFELKTMGLQDAESLVNELLVLNRIPSHPFIIQLYAAFRERSSISFVMDLLIGGDLRLLIRLGENLTEKKIAYLIACIGSALHHIHLHQIIHRDIKPDNIMFTANGIPKLIDFGISYLSPIYSPAVCVCQLRSGTRQYISPEASVSETHYHGYESDYWSLGIVMYELIYFQRPYETTPPLELVNYSEQMYKVTWEYLLTQIAAATPSPSPIMSPLHEEFNTNQTRTITVTQATPSSPSNVSTSLSSVIGLLNFPPMNEEEEAGPLPLELSIPLPPLTALNQSPSKNCISLLSSLLDVRIHKRLGVGENYSLFTQHPFFTSNNIDVDNISLYPSPITPDMDQIGLHLWNQFFSINLEDFNPLPWNPYSSQDELTGLSINHEVEVYLERIQAISPLFYETS